MRKSQSGMNAAILIAILSALIVIYIIFLPSEDRLDIVGENESEREERRTGTRGEILLEDSSIIMEHISDKEVERDLPSVNLYTSTEADVISEVNSIYVKNGVFDKEDKEIDFKISNPDNTDNILISFFAKKSKGILKISLNNFEIFSGEVDKVNADPIKVSSDFIAATNKLKIEVSSVGAAFWNTNEYLLENFKITGDVTDVSTREASLSFVIPSAEAKNIEEAELRFVPECEEGKIGTLDISVNNHQIYSSVPDCGVQRPLEFSPFHIVSGENTLTFRSHSGRYLIDQIRIDTQLEETPSFTYFFEIDDDDFDDIRDGDKRVNLTFFFVDDREDKEAEIFINDRKTFMTRHDDFDFSIDITRFIEEERHQSLKIVPEERLEVRKLQVLLQDDD